MWQKTNHHMQTIILGQQNRREETGKPLWNFNSHYSYLALFLAWGRKSSHCVSPKRLFCVAAGTTTNLLNTLIRFQVILVTWKRLLPSELQKVLFISSFFFFFFTECVKGVNSTRMPFHLWILCSCHTEQVMLTKTIKQTLSLGRFPRTQTMCANMSKTKRTNMSWGWQRDWRDAADLPAWLRSLWCSKTTGLLSHAREAWRQPGRWAAAHFPGIPS